MKLIPTILIATILITSSALAVVDPDPDGVGVYFDLGADFTESVVGTNFPIFVYVILTNPTGAEIQGFALSYRLVVPAGMEGLVFRLAEDFPWPVLDLGVVRDTLEDQLVLKILKNF